MSTYYAVVRNDIYLEHHGIKGQKWGVRRYQNFDGSYTKAGLQRYYKSLDKYQQKKAEYKAIKKDKTKSKYEKQYAKGKMLEAKRRMNKDYKHLKYDKLGDEGKVLYAQGKRITENTRVTSFLNKAGSAAITASVLSYKYKDLIEDQLGISVDTKVSVALASAGAVAIGASAIKSVLDERPNKRLRAYYSHTSNY